VINFLVKVSGLLMGGLQKLKIPRSSIRIKICFIVNLHREEVLPPHNLRKRKEQILEVLLEQMPIFHMEVMRTQMTKRKSPKDRKSVRLERSLRRSPCGERCTMEYLRMTIRSS
jgi:hypothetical protein